MYCPSQTILSEKQCSILLRMFLEDLLLILFSENEPEMATLYGFGEVFVIRRRSRSVFCTLRWSTCEHYMCEIHPAFLGQLSCHVEHQGDCC